MYSYTWTPDMFPISENSFAPEETTTVYIQIDDGCSDPGIDSLIIQVLPPIEFSVETSDTLCFEARQCGCGSRRWRINQ